MSEEPRVIGKVFDSLREDLDCVFVMTKISHSPSEPDQVFGAWFFLDVLACLRKFRFKLTPRLFREWRRNLLGAFQTRLPDYCRAT
jgi:hypothetical protein